MSLAHAYASVIQEAEQKGEGAAFVKNLLALMKSRGHLSLLAQIFRIIEREPENTKAPVVVLAKEEDAKKYSKMIRDDLATLNARDHRTVLNPRSVGGYSVRAGSKIIDKSFRSALVSLYQRAIR